MTSSKPVSEDPLVAALPPATDYITYLTLLEYQLTPKNLSTLNRLLTSDDGRLAEEIGWDLLKLVLPMLEVNPQDATTCLETIARRGNPREVVVQVAEELEKLGRSSDDENNDNGDQSDADTFEEDSDNKDTDDLPTFAGEATRIYLGNMKLDGMPDTNDNQKTSQSHTKLDPEERKTTSTEDNDSIKLQTLLMLLGILHPRIKTQYPSRFLATSLPAAFGSYRRNQIDTATTYSFLALLGKLSGKQKPALPPRTTSNIEGSDKIQQTRSTAPLPDSGASIEPVVGNGTASALEKSINTRLLQAVLLELMDEYMSSFARGHPSCMCWTSRLREKLDSDNMVPGKQSQTMNWKETIQTKARDEISQRFTDYAKELSLTSAEELLKLVVGRNQDDLPQKPDEQDDEVSEYPTSPSQIDFPLTGLVLLHAAEQFYSETPSTTITFADVAQLLMRITPLSEIPLLPAPSIQDALLSLLYRATITSDSSSINSSVFSQLLSILTQTFIITPTPQIRDDAHHIATKLLHSRTSIEERLGIIKETIQCSTPNPDDPTSDSIPLSPPHTESALKAIGVDWLKDEIRTFFKTEGDKGLDPGVLETDKTLHSMIFTDISPPDTATNTTMFLLSLPFYISTLNLLYVVLSNSGDADGSQTLHEKAATYLTSLKAWRDHLLPILLGSDEIGDVDEEMIADVKESGPDVFALDDACGRLRTVIS